MRVCTVSINNNKNTHIAQAPSSGATNMCHRRHRQSEWGHAHLQVRYQAVSYSTRKVRDHFISVAKCMVSNTSKLETPTPPWYRTRHLPEAKRSWASQPAGKARPTR